jgi:hypothetical protein
MIGRKLLYCETDWMLGPDSSFFNVYDEQAQYLSLSRLFVTTNQLPLPTIFIGTKLRGSFPFGSYSFSREVIAQRWCATVWLNEDRSAWSYRYYIFLFDVEELFANYSGYVFSSVSIPREIAAIISEFALSSHLSNVLRRRPEQIGISISQQPFNFELTSDCPSSAAEVETLTVNYRPHEYGYRPNSEQLEYVE